MYKAKKAQLSLTDFIIALTIFMILMIAMILNLNTYPTRLNEQQNKNEMLMVAFQFSDLLIRSPGNPTLWENNISNVKIIGLAESDRNLSTTKVDNFIELDYDDTKIFTGFYDFYFRIIDYNNNEILNYGLPFDGTSSVIIRRHIIYNNENAIMELTFWK